MILVMYWSIDIGHLFAVSGAQCAVAQVDRPIISAEWLFIYRPNRLYTGFWTYMHMYNAEIKF